MAARIRARVVDELADILTTCFGADAFTITTPDADGYATIELHGRTRLWTDTVQGVVNAGFEDVFCRKIDKRTLQVR